MLKLTKSVSNPGIARNAILNFLAMLFPLLLAILLIPTIVQGLGVERFGILALIWGVFTYFSIMDFGLGRALTHAVATRLNTRREDEIQSALSHSLILISCLAVLLTLLGLAIAPSLVDRVLAIPRDYRDETLISFQLLAGGLALVATSSALNGYLAAFERFDLVNLVKVPLMAGTLCAPLLAIGNREPILVSTALMVFLRVVAWITLIVMCRIATPPSIAGGQTRVAGFKALLSFSGWISLINLLNAVLTHADRWALAVWASLATVTYYTVPFEVATKLWIIPSAVAAAMFPVFCRVSTHPSSLESERLLYFGTGFTMAISFIATMVIAVFAGDILLVWLGEEFAKQSTSVFQILLIGTFINSIAHTAATLLQAKGHPQWIAYLLLAELPLFCVALWICVPMLGALGAALVWTGRVAVDAAALWYLARRCLARSAPTYPSLGIAFGAFLGTLIIGASIPSTIGKFFYCGFALILFLAVFVRLNRHARSQIMSGI